MDNPKLLTNVRELRLNSARHATVATNGCFDILHPGHVHFLQEARKLGMQLVVGINDDRSVRMLKGPDRPIFPAALRAFVVAGLECVDWVYVFRGKRATRFLDTVCPAIWVKGDDYNIDTVDKGERDVVLKNGGEIRFIPLMTGFSTTRILKLL